jgi:PAS domain S-box-containing protein
MPLPHQEANGRDGRSLDEVLQTDRRFRELVDNLDSVFWIYDPVSIRVDYVSPAYERMWGRSCASLLADPRSFMEPIFPEDVGRVHQAMTQHPENRQTRVEYRITHPDGTVRWIEDSGFPIADSAGKVRRVAGVAIDITARKAAEGRAHLLSEVSRVLGGTLEVPELYAKLAQIVVPELADVAMVDLLEDGRIHRATVHGRPGMERVAQAVMGFAPSPEQHRHPLVRAMTERRLICEPMSEEAKAVLGATPERMKALLALNPRFFVAVPLISRGRVLGGLQYIRSDPARPDFSPEDLALIEEISRRTSIFVDNASLYQDAELARHRAEAIAITLAEHVERLSAVEAQLTSAVRLRDDFLSVASHELKTPLTTLRLQVDALRRHGMGSELPDEIRRHSVARIHFQLGRLERLVEELLDVSRIQAGHLELRPEVMDLADLAVEVVSVFQQHPAYADRIHLRCEGGVVGRWDRARLDQILTNLVSNALKYGRDLPVDVTIQAEDEAALVRVSDRGIGIPQAELKRVFERFERAAPPEHYGGLGLGLWIVREIIEAMGGTITVESRVDVGSTFTARLPRYPEQFGVDGLDTGSVFRPL